MYAHAHSVTADSNRIGVVAMKSLSDEVESLCLVKEDRELKFHFNTFFFMTEILTDTTNMKKSIKKIDKEIGKVCLEGPFNCTGCESGGS